MSSRLQNSAGRSGPKRDARRARERGEVENQVGLLLGRVGERIAEHEAAFGVGVVDFDGEAGARGNDFAGAIGVAGDGILDGGDQQGQAHGQLGLHHQPGQRDRVRGAAHVLFHPAHTIGGV